MSRYLTPSALSLAFLALAPTLLPASSITIINPSFQEQDFANFPGYLGGANPAAINGWTAAGGAGINGTDIGAGAPFADNGTIPDNSRVAFIQGTGSLSQTVSGLIPGKQYWLQIYANSRNNALYTMPLADVSFGGAALLTGQPVPSVGGTAAYHKVNLPFTATASSGSIMVTSNPSVPGDSALLMDGFTLIQRDAGEVVIYNPSFEASGTGLPFPGYIPTVAGWTKTLGVGGNVAINTAGGPFSNSFMPEGLNHAVLQNEVSLSQQLSGVVIGDTYRLSLDYYGRDGTAPTALITVDGQTALSGLIPNTGGQLSLTYDFVATSANPTLSIANLGVGADSSFLFDNISLRAIPEPSGSLLALLSGAVLLRRRRTA
ncbi:MAG: hypothetical protein JWL81_2262 [Verrucomicrobiales bacterium]|nr:hypothetical protein [Verrucomicrobiales bacterium]